VRDIRLLCLQAKYFNIIQTPNTLKHRNVMSKNIHKIGRKNNILIKKECTPRLSAINEIKAPPPEKVKSKDL